MGLLSDMSVLAKSTVSSFQKAEALGSGDLSLGRGPGAALIADPFVWGMANTLYREKPAPVSYAVLRFLSSKDTLLATIILTRLRQIKAFSRLRMHEESEKANNTGFRVRYKDGAGERTQAVQKREDEINNFILHCGRPDVDKQEESFANFLWKFTKDRLEIDQACAELRYDGKGDLVEFFAVDGSTIRIVDVLKHGVDENDAKYVQLFQSQVVAKFLDHELAFCPENISTALYMNGYSTAETEIALKKIQSHLGIDETNSRQFHPASMPKGLMTLSGADMSEEQVQLLEAKWRSQVSNFRGKHRVPFLPVPRGASMSFIHLPQATDIEHGNFLDYLVNTVTGLYGMDPVEINFPNRSGGIAGATPSMIQSSPEATRLTASRDKGLRTLLAFLEDCINKNIISQLDPDGDFEFAFIGFDRQTESDRLASDDKQSSVYKTINEIREARGLEPRDDCDIIRDNVWFQAKQATMMQQEQAQMEEPVEQGAVEQEQMGEPADQGVAEQGVVGDDTWEASAEDAEKAELW